MGCRKNLFGGQSNCKGVVPESAATHTTHSTEVVVADRGSVQDDAVLPAGSTQAGTSCTPCRNEDVTAAISEAGASSSRCMVSPMPTVTASEMATPDAEKKYTHGEDIDPALIPKPGMTFRNREEARAFYEKYAGKVGFNLSYGNKKPYSYIIQCSNEGVHEYFKKDEDLRVRNNTTKKTHCMSKMKLKRIYDENKNQISVEIEQVDLMHNHPFLKKPEETVNMPSHKEKNPVFFEMVDGMQAAGVPHHSLQTYVRDMHDGAENVPITTKDLENRKAANVRAEHANDISKLLEFFDDCRKQNPKFYWNVKVDNEGTVHSLFWSYASMQAEYIDFGDVITFDTTHKANIYDKPLALFVGANHHLQNTYFGCALLGDETKETFQWVFKAFKKCMGKQRTTCILTDQDQAMEAALALEFPGVIHRICRWHVVIKHMPGLNELFSLFEERNFKDTFKSVLNHPLTPEEFERAWDEMIKSFDLQGNATMESLYRERARYIPAYFKGDYCGMMTSTQRSESSNYSMKKNFVGKQTCLHKFAKRTLDFMQTRKRKEGTETYLSTSKTLTKSKWGFEVQLGRVYTRAVFRNFEDKVFKSSAYNIEADQELGDHWYRVYHRNVSEVISWGQHRFIVKVDKDKESYTCECREWEHTGLFCVHLLRAFIHVQVAKIHPDYIRRRYTRFARSNVDFDTNDKQLTGEDGDTQSYRIKTLIPKAMKAVRSGSMSNPAYRRLLDVLEDVTKELESIPKDIGAEARRGQDQTRAEDFTGDGSSDEIREDGRSEETRTQDNVSGGNEEQHVGRSSQGNTTTGKESGTLRIIEGRHVLDCSQDRGKKNAGATPRYELSQHGHDETTMISLVPPEKAKPKGRNLTESEKASITLGAQGEKLGTRKCQACGLYATHNSRTCLSLEHNRARLEEKKKRKRGRPPGAKNKKKSWKQGTDRGEDDIRVKTRKKVTGENMYAVWECDSDYDTEEEAGSEQVKGTLAIYKYMILLP